MRKTLIIGGGAAGMLSSVIAGRAGDEVLLFEQNEKLGKKLYITGKGRCNFTNAGTMEDLFDSLMTNRKFMFSSLYGYNNFDIMDFFEEMGLEYKIERGNRVFPVSDHSYDVINALHDAMIKANVKIHLNTKVEKLHVKDGVVRGLYADGQYYEGDRVIVATGGISYPSTGSTGDGYRFAKETGHEVTELIPSLVPMNVKEDYIKEMQGLSLKNVTLTLKKNGKVLYEEFGEMMFTHFGVTGPIVLSAASHIKENIKYKIFIDLKPALDTNTLDKRLLRDFSQVSNKNFSNSLEMLLPKKLIPVIIKLSGILPDKKVNSITKEERSFLLKVIKELPLTVRKLRPISEAIITSGGIQIKEINPSSMESKLCENLYFCGEVMDVDAYTGGFNLQIAFSTGYLAGEKAAQKSLGVF